jgi:hypothetical protein
MSFQPLAPFGGTIGWNFMQRTKEAQEQLFARSPSVARLSEHFTSRIGSVRSADDLVSDRQLLRVALGAFGLDGDINNRFFIRKVLEEGTADRGALANRLADKRYLALAEAFGFGDRLGGNTQRPDFAEGIVSRYRERQFESAVGQANPDMRLALGLRRELTELSARTMSNDGRWFTMMANPPLRAVFERALSLPSSVGGLDIDRQLSIFKERAQSRLGTADFASLAKEEGYASLVKSFLTSADLGGAGAPAARGSAALALLTSSVALRR